jgi:hypothetical protein
LFTVSRVDAGWVTTRPGGLSLLEKPPAEPDFPADFRAGWPGHTNHRIAQQFFDRAKVVESR